MRRSGRSTGGRKKNDLLGRGTELVAFVHTCNCSCRQAIPVDASLPRQTGLRSSSFVHPAVEQMLRNVFGQRREQHVLYGVTSKGTCCGGPWEYTTGFQRRARLETSRQVTCSRNLTCLQRGRRGTGSEAAVSRGQSPEGVERRRRSKCQRKQNTTKVLFCRFHTHPPHSCRETVKVKEIYQLFDIWG